MALYNIYLIAWLLALINFKSAFGQDTSLYPRGHVATGNEITTTLTSKVLETTTSKSTCLVTFTRIHEPDGNIITQSYTPRPSSTSPSATIPTACAFPTGAIHEFSVIDFTDLGLSGVQPDLSFAANGSLGLNYDGIFIPGYYPWSTINCDMYHRDSEIGKSCKSEYALFSNVSTNQAFISLYLGSDTAIRDGSDYYNAFFTIHSLWVTSLQFFSANDPSAEITEPLSDFQVEFTGYRYDGNRPACTVFIKPPCGGGPTFVEGLDKMGFVNMKSFGVRAWMKKDKVVTPLRFVLDDLDVKVKRLPSTESYCL